VTPLPPLGRWRLLRADATIEFLPGAILDFRDAAHLEYTFDIDGHAHSVALRYRTEGDLLRTEVPGTTHEATARFEFGPARVLVLDFAGARAWFVPELPSTAHGAG
jgi:hypothetical protein